MKLKEFKAELKPTNSKHNFSSHKNIINKLLLGNMVSQMKNRGFEFEDYRVYTKNDDASRIDWKATLRSNQLLLRETTEEKAVNVVFLVDVSDTMLFSSGEKLKCEYAAEIVCSLSFTIQREGNAIGLALFNEKIQSLVRPKVGSKQYFDIIKMISTKENYGGKSNLKNAIKNALAILKVPSLLVIISDFIDIGEDWETYLEMVSLKYNVIGICVRDKLDRNIPKNAGYFVIEDPKSDKKTLIDTKEHYQTYKEEIKHEEEYLDKSFKNAKSSYIVLQTDEDFTNPLIRFLEKRSRIKK